MIQYFLVQHNQGILAHALSLKRSWFMRTCHCFGIFSNTNNSFSNRSKKFEKFSMPENFHAIVWTADILQCIHFFYYFQ